MRILNAIALKKPLYAYKRWWLSVAFALVFWFNFPNPLFNDPYSTVILDKNGKLLSAQIATDGQWRFPEVDSVPTQLEQAVLYFEDEYFYFHPGVNPVSLARAFVQNIQQQRVVSGGSTISMQVIRLSRKNPARTYLEKLYELLLALRLELQYSKQEILQLYVSHAPYGGNVVGVEAASWRYFNRPINQLSWSEYALLAVLPNAPSLLHLSKNTPLLEAKRNRLLQKLADNKIISETTRSLAAMEPLPQAPLPLPNLAFHLLQRVEKEGGEGNKVSTTLHKETQQIVHSKLNRYVELLAQNQVHNAAALVANVQTGEVLAYVGNAALENTPSKFVDLIQANRSSGSILKPFLYAKAFELGLIHPKTLLRDVPISIGNYSPQNFDKSYAGMVPAEKALANSLNIPAALLLKEYGLGLFYNNLQELGFTTINRGAENYGLSLILGGAEVSLWEVANAYLNQTNALLVANNSEVRPSSLYFSGGPKSRSSAEIQSAAWWQVAEALTTVTRPGAQQDWQRYSSSQKIAWKTGTSHGFRDAWAVGFNQNYLVAVWVGNADGEGRQGLTGVSAAAPLLFSLFDYLPRSEQWFQQPDGLLQPLQLCAESGKLPNEFCPKVESVLPFGAQFTEQCNYHSLVFLNNEGKRVSKNCSAMAHDTVWFHLNPVEEYYFKQKHSFYKPLPPYSVGCKSQFKQPVEIIYPLSGTQIYVPKNLDGSLETILLQAASSNSNSALFWHLNEAYVGTTSGVHQLAVSPTAGEYTLLVVDEQGNSAEVKFRIAAKD